MNTAKCWAQVFIDRTTGRRAIFQVNTLTLNAVKVVLKGVQMSLDEEDLKRGYLRRDCKSGFYGGADGYIPTAKGFRKILAELS
jgi:hypothetical protein